VPSPRTLSGSAAAHPADRRLRHAAVLPQLLLRRPSIAIGSASRCAIKQHPVTGVNTIDGVPRDSVWKAPWADLQWSEQL